METKKFKYHNTPLELLYVICHSLSEKNESIFPQRRHFHVLTFFNVQPEEIATLYVKLQKKQCLTQDKPG